MRAINRRSLLKGAVGVAGAAGAAALTPLLDSPVVLADAAPAGPGLAGAPKVAPHLLATTAGMQYTYLPGYDFVPRYSTTPWSWSNASIYQPSGTIDGFRHTAGIPKGATVHEILYQVVKNDANALRIEGVVLEPSSGGGNILYDTSPNPTASASVQSVAATFTPFQYDPAQSTFLVVWMPGTTSTTHRLYGVRIGYTFAGGSTVMLPTPIRVVDTRGGSSAQFDGGGALIDGEDRTYGPFNGLPSDATGIVANLTACWYSADGYLSIFPAGAATPATSTLNFTNRSYATANGVTAGLGSGANAGMVTVLASVPGGNAHVLLDIVGYTRST